MLPEAPSASSLKTRPISGQRLIVVVALTLFLTATADAFFYSARHAGWTLAAYVALLLGAALWRMPRKGWSLPLKITASAVAGLAFALLLEPGPLRFLMAVTGLAMVMILRTGHWTGDPRIWAERFCWLVPSGMIRLWRDFHGLSKLAGKRGGIRIPDFGGVRGWVLPVVMSGVFVLLFAEANPVIAKWLAAVTEWFGRLADSINISIDMARVCFWGFLLPIIWVYLRLRIVRERASTTKARTARPLSDPWPVAEIAPAVLMRCLVMFNGIFAVQTLLDLRYLAGGASLPEGMTYAEYAHRGAYPLLVVALLSAGFVLVAFRPGGAGEVLKPTRRLVFAWLAQNVFLTLTSAWRLNLYMDAYLLTRMRIAAAIWLLLVGAGLVWITVRLALRLSNNWLLRINAASVVLVLYACCFVPFDRIIADFNVTHCKEVAGEGPGIDLDYLDELGLGALPALARLNSTGDRLSAEQRTALVMLIRERREKLESSLKDWRGWTLLRGRMAGATAPGSRPSKDEAGPREPASSSQSAL